MIPRVLTIAGSDSGGGAGIQADLKTFSVVGVYGMTAITAVTAQNTLGVQGIHVIPAAFVRRQIDAVVSDIGVDAVKTGMLASAEIVTTVARAIREHTLQPCVVDPVMAAHGGSALSLTDLQEILIRELIPLANLVTPNIPEATALTGIAIDSVADMRRAARALIERCGSRASLVKGGHRDADQATDVFDDGTTVREFTTPRLAARHTHGTGCQLSAAIAAYLARGCALEEAIERAKQFITSAIRHGLAIGRGTGPANPLAWSETDASGSSRKTP